MLSGTPSAVHGGWHYEIVQHPSANAVSQRQRARGACKGAQGSKLRRREARLLGLLPPLSTRGSTAAVGTMPASPSPAVRVLGCCCCCLAAGLAAAGGGFTPLALAAWAAAISARPPVVFSIYRMGGGGSPTGFSPPMAIAGLKANPMQAVMAAMMLSNMIF